MRPPRLPTAIYSSFNLPIEEILISHLGRKLPVSDKNLSLKFAFITAILVLKVSCASYFLDILKSEILPEVLQLILIIGNFLNSVSMLVLSFRICESLGPVR